MRKVISCTIAGLAGLAMSAPSLAQFASFEPADGGIYFSGFAGGGFASDAGFNGEQNPAAGVAGVAGAPANVVAEFDTDIFYGGAIGYQLPFTSFKYFHPRVEIEVSSLDSDVSAGSFNGGNQTFSGDQSQLFLFLNSYNDIKWNPNQRFIPYIGGGIGVAFIDENILYFPNNGTATAPTVGVFNDETAIATHGAIGMTYKFTDSLEVYTEGRYTSVYGVDAERRFIANDGFNADVSDRINGFSATGGIRVRF